MKLTIDDRVGVHNKDIEIAPVELGEALAWLRKLDGQQYTLLSLERHDGARLLIGGGAFYFVITLDKAGSSFLFLNDSIYEDGTYELCAGGQYGEYLKKNCATMQQSEHIAKLFFDKNEDRLSWR